jgi:dihydroxy-acid dehydratase
MVKKSGIEPDVLVHTGPAVVSDSAEDVRTFLLERGVNPGSVPMVRYEGPKGGPDIQDLSIPAAMLVGVGLHTSVAMITYGRFPGATRGPCVGHMCLGARFGGALAWVQDGDRIEMNVPERCIQLLILQEELRQREADGPEPPSHPVPGFSGCLPGDGELRG